MTNGECLRKANIERNLIKAIRQRQSSSTGHKISKEGLENVVTKGKINGREAGEVRRKKKYRGHSKAMAQYKVIDCADGKYQ